MQDVAAVPVRKRTEKERLAQGPRTPPAEQPMADELDISSPRLRTEQLAPELVHEDRDPQLGPHFQERRIEPTDVGLDPAHPRLEEDCVDAEMAEQRGLGRHCRAMVRLGSSPCRRERTIRATASASRVSAPLDPASDPASPTGVLDLPTAGGKVIRGSALRGGAYAATVALGSSPPRLTRHLGVVDFGRYVTVVSIVTVAIGMSDVGLSNIGVREYSIREGADRDFTMKNLLGLRIALTGVAVVIAVAFAAAAGYPAVMVVGTMVAAIGFVLTTVQHSLGVPLSAGLRLGWVAGLDVLRQAGLVLAVVVLVLIGAGLLGVLAAPVPIAIVLVLLTAWLVRGTIPFVPAFDTRAWGRLLRLVLPYAAASAIGAVYVSLVVVLTSLVASQEETGYFSAAFRVFSVLSAVPSLLVASAFPILARAARDDRERLRYALQRLWDASLVIGAGAAVLTAVGAPVAIAVSRGQSTNRPSPPPDHGRSAVRVVLRGHLGLSGCFHRRLSQPSSRSDRACRRGGLALALAPEYGADGAAWPPPRRARARGCARTSAHVVARRPPSS